jgi:acylglycerol lipase
MERDDTHPQGVINDPLFKCRRAVVSGRDPPRGLGIGLLIVGLLMAGGCAPTTDRTARLEGIGTARAAPGPKPMPHFAGDLFIAADGVALPLRRWLPKEDAGERVAAVVLALHGFNDYSNAFAGPGDIWAKDGIATYAYDQRGFGGAAGRGRWPGRSVLAADAAAAALVLRQLYPNVPLYLLGESMGGAVAVVAMTGESGTPIPSVDGVILVAPAVWGRATMDFLQRAALSLGVRLMPGLTLTGSGLHIMASDNIVMLRAYSRDPLVIKETRIDTIYGLVDLMDAAVAAAPKLRAPLLVMSGKEDQIVPRAATRRFVQALAPGSPPDHPRITPGSPPDQVRGPGAAGRGPGVDPGGSRSLAFYPHGYHMLLRDLDGPVVIADAAGWMLDPGAPLLSGADRGAAEALLNGTGHPPFGGG